MLHRELREAKEYVGSYNTVQRWVRPLRAAAEPEAATARYETAPAAQAQVDWGMLKVWIGETKVTVHLFVMVLGYSRRIFTRAYLHERLGNLLDGHEAAVERLGGGNGNGNGHGAGVVPNAGTTRPAPRARAPKSVERLPFLETIQL